MDVSTHAVNLLAAAGWAVAGGVGWTLAEYLMHRFDGHGMKGRTRFSREHLAHHANGMYFAPAHMKALMAIPVLLVMGALTVPLLGGLAGGAFTGGFMLTYLAYEVLHRRIHTHPPTGPYSRWARRHHLYHHFKSPRTNHGVTSPIWDHVFKTYEAPGRIRVPAKQVMPWLMVDGAVRPECEADYEVVTPRRDLRAAA